MRILIAEDEVELAKGLKFLLEKNKFSVDTVNNGADALDYFHSTDYDVIVLDIMMPKKNGMEVLSQIRSEGAAVPVLMLTARSEIEGRGRRLSPQAVCHQGIYCKSEGACPQKCRICRYGSVTGECTARL